MSSVAASTGPPLPPNWKAAKDQAGKVYYYNKVTRETRWEHPAGPVAAAITVVASPTSPPTSAPLPVAALAAVNENTVQYQQLTHGTPVVVPAAKPTVPLRHGSESSSSSSGTTPQLANGTSATVPSLGRSRGIASNPALSSVAAGGVGSRQSSGNDIVASEISHEGITRASLADLPEPGTGRKSVADLAKSFTQLSKQQQAAAATPAPVAAVRGSRSTLTRVPGKSTSTNDLFSGTSVGRLPPHEADHVAAPKPSPLVALAPAAPMVQSIPLSPASPPPPPPPPLLSELPPAPATETAIDPPLPPPPPPLAMASTSISPSPSANTGAAEMGHLPPPPPPLDLYSAGVSSPLPVSPSPLVIAPPPPTPVTPQSAFPKSPESAAPVVGTRPLRNAPAIPGSLGTEPPSRQSRVLDGGTVPASVVAAAASGEAASVAAPSPLPSGDAVAQDSKPIPRKFKDGNMGGFLADLDKRLSTSQNALNSPSADGKKRLSSYGPMETPADPPSISRPSTPSRPVSGVPTALHILAPTAVPTITSAENAEGTSSPTSPVGDIDSFLHATPNKAGAGGFVSPRPSVSSNGSGEHSAASPNHSMFSDLDGFEDGEELPNGHEKSGMAGFFKHGRRPSFGLGMRKEKNKDKGKSEDNAAGSSTNSSQAGSTPSSPALPVKGSGLKAMVTGLGANPNDGRQRPQSMVESIGGMNGGSPNASGVNGGGAFNTSLPASLSLSGVSSLTGPSSAPAAPVPTSGGGSMSSLSTSSGPMSAPVKEKEKGSGFSRLFKKSSPTAASSSASALSHSSNAASSAASVIFGGSLVTLGGEDAAVHPLLAQCIPIVEERGPKTEGVYRLSGNSAAIQRHRAAWQAAAAAEASGAVPTWPDVASYDVNVVTGTLKLFLRELVDPVLMCELYGDWVAAGKLQMGPARCTAVEALLARLPQAHLTTLHALVKHLARLAVHSEATKMDPSNLAIVFGPTLVRPKVESMETILNTEPQNAVVADLIINVTRYFPGPDPLGLDGLSDGVVVVAGSPTSMSPTLGPTATGGGGQGMVLPPLPKLGSFTVPGMNESMATSLSTSPGGSRRAPNQSGM